MEEEGGIEEGRKREGGGGEVKQSGGEKEWNAPLSLAIHFLCFEIIQNIQTST